MKRISTIGMWSVIALLATAGLPAQTPPDLWENKAPLPTPRGFSTASVLGGEIYVIGGALSPSESTAVVEAFNPQENTWTTKKSLPLALCAAASAVVGDKIYVIGGKTAQSSFSYLNSVYEYDPVLDEWNLLPYTMPTPRAFFSTCVIGDSLIYSIGGRISADFGVATVEKFNPLSGWDTLPDLNTGRSNFTAEVVDGKIYVMAGVDENPGLPATVEVFNPDSVQNGWVIIDTLPEEAQRYLHYSGTHKGKIYLLGGIDITYLQPNLTVYRYDPVIGKLDLLDTMSKIKVACAATVFEDSIFGIGGVLYPFFDPGLPGPKVFDNNLRYFFPSVSTKEGMTILAPARLSQNAPNPFAAQTSISYEIKRSGEVCMRVFSLNGQPVATLFDGHQESGAHTVIWDAGGMPSGIYLYQLKTEEGVWTRKCILQNH